MLDTKEWYKEFEKWLEENAEDDEEYEDKE